MEEQYLTDYSVTVAIAAAMLETTAAILDSVRSVPRDAPFHLAQPHRVATDLVEERVAQAAVFELPAVVLAAGVAHRRRAQVLVGAVVADLAAHGEEGLGVDAA